MIGYQTIVIAVFIGIIPAVVMAWWFFGRGKEKIGINLLFKMFFWGVLTAIPASVFQIINLNNPNGNMVVNFFQQLSGIWSNYFITHSVVPFVFVALVEEGSKGVGIALSLWSISKSKRASRLKINPGALAGVIVGLAFGVTENGVYFANNFAGSAVTNSLASIVLLRFILSTSAHIMYSGLFGSFLVDTLVAKTFSKRLLAILGLSIPIIIHMTFDVLVTTSGLGILSVPLLIGGLFLLIFKTFWSR